MNLDDKETGRRLAEHLCVWCARRLDDDSADATFCRQVCEHAWHAWRNGNALADEPAPEPPNPRTVNDLNMTNMVPPQRLDPDEAAQREAEERAVRAWQRKRHMYQLDVEPEPVVERTTRLGPSLLDMPALITGVGSPPHPDAYPYREVARQARQGMLIPAGALAAVRTCQYCGHTGAPSQADVTVPQVQVPEAGWPLSRAFATNPTQLNTPDWTTRPARLRQQGCTQCGVETPGPPVAALVRPAPQIDGWELCAATTRWVSHYSITRAQLEQAPRADTFMARVWESVYRNATLHSTRCGIPFCPHPCTKWVRTAAPLTYQGCQWTPTTKPIQIGLCQAHEQQLLVDLLHSPDLADRAHHHALARTHTWE